LFGEIKLCLLLIPPPLATEILFTVLAIGLKKMRGGGVPRYFLKGITVCTVELLVRRPAFELGTSEHKSKLYHVKQISGCEFDVVLTVHHP